MYKFVHLTLPVKLYIYGFFQLFVVPKLFLEFMQEESKMHVFTGLVFDFACAVAIKVIAAGLKATAWLVNMHNSSCSMAARSAVDLDAVAVSQILLSSLCRSALL